MALQIYNTLTKKKEEFTTLTPGKVKMYACGVTVYDESHIGHASQAIIFDVIRNYLEYSGYEVTYVRNFTDIDDKIIKKANETGKDALEISSHFIKRSQEDMALLKIRPATHEPRVSNHIPDIISFIEGLISKGHAYQAGGDVLFDISTFKEYGKLSKRKIDELINEDTGAKKNPGDFALWKGVKPGEPSWDSPWGKGRPGWHIECSVMAKKYLGETLDIHGGGMDLVFPHHENEIAQSEALHDKPFSRFWIHNGLIMVNRQKMSKSLGNFYTITRAAEKAPTDVIRFMILSCHYGSNIDFMESNLTTASKRVHYFYRTLSKISQLCSSVKETDSEDLLKDLNTSMEKEFRAAMDDDFSTAKVIAFLSETFSQINEFLDDKSIKPGRKIHSLNNFKTGLLKVTSVLNILNDEPEAFLKSFRTLYLKNNGIDEKEITDLINKRSDARKAKDFTLSDKIRDELADKNILVQDTPSGTEWDILFK
ncbi:MAG: cysteine--tRNA ligase [Spirochaetales bacterium]|nr:cysteine--tRNA ligase [Spirochaetales bacterium]